MATRRSCRTQTFHGSRGGRRGLGRVHRPPILFIRKIRQILQGYGLKSGGVPILYVARAIERTETSGLMKIVIDAMQTGDRP